MSLQRGTMLLVLVALLGQPAAAAGKLKVVATLTDLGWLAAKVGGQDIEVTVLCPGSQDPHYLPAKPSLARKLREADLLIYNGLELEIGWLPLLLDASRNPRVKSGSRGELDCAAAVTNILEVPAGEVDRSQGDIHPLGNPHYLLDPRNGAAVALLIAERMAELDPPAAGRFRQRAATLAADITSSLPGWKQAAAPAVACQVIVFHKQWEYLLHWLGWESLGAVEHRPGISPSPRHVEDMIRLGRAQDCVILMAATWNHLDAARKAAGRMQAPLVVLPAAGEATEEASGYLALFEVITRGLHDAVAVDQSDDLDEEARR